MKKSTRRRIRLPIGQAKTVVLARAIEESGAASEALNKETIEAIGVKTAHALGENRDAARNLVLRAEEIVRIANASGVKTSFAAELRAVGWVTGILALAAFCIGALTDRFTSSSNTVNLLSPPFWTVVFWNLAVYVFLFLSACLSIAGKDMPAPTLRGAVSALLERISFVALRKGTVRARFCTAWAAVLAPLTRLASARALHLAAAAFALGLIVSMSVRGIGTSYWAVWESTWFADEPETIRAILEWTYGLVPALPGLAPLPDTETLAQMRSDQLPFLKEGFSAGPWLVRMMLITALTVIVPRLLLALAAWLRMSWFIRHVPVAIDNPYFAAALKHNPSRTEEGGIFVAVPQVLSEDALCRVKTVLDLAGSKGDRWLSVLPEDGETPLPVGTRLATLLCEGTSVPENEQSEEIERLKTAATGRRASLAVLVDMTAFTDRMAAYPERISERRAVWENFASEHGTSAVFFTGGPAEQLAAARCLQDAAAAMEDGKNA